MIINNNAKITKFFEYCLYWQYQIVSFKALNTANLSCSKYEIQLLISNSVMTIIINHHAQITSITGSSLNRTWSEIKKLNSLINNFECKFEN